MEIKTKNKVFSRLLPDIKDTFDLLDRNKDGKLSKGELETLLRYNGSLISDQEIDELLEPIDTNRKFVFQIVISTCKYLISLF